MDAFFHIIQAYESWFYVLFGAIGLIYLRKVILAIEELRSSLFGLEKEHAQTKVGLSLSVIGLVSAMALVIFILNSFVIPAMPRLHPVYTPTIDVLTTETATLAPTLAESGTPGTPQVVKGVSLTATPTPSSEGCVHNQLEWSSPQPGDELSGTVTLKGTVNILNSGFYKYEFSSTGSNKWTTIAAGSGVIKNDELGHWNTTPYASGDYLLRLVVADNNNKLLPACIVPVKIIQK